MMKLDQALRAQLNRGFCRQMVIVVGLSFGAVIGSFFSTCSKQYYKE